MLTSVAAMAAISLVGRMLGPSLLGEYLLVRRMASWLQAVVGLPSGIALPRYVAASVEEPVLTRQTYFVGALLTGCGLAVLLTVLFLIQRGFTSRLIFGNAAFAPLVLPLGLLLAGLAAHGVVFGFYQGTLSMGRASILQICNLAFFPVLAVLLLSQRKSIPQIVEATGLSMILAASLFSLPIVCRANLAAITRHLFKPISQLLSFGLSRAWGDFGLQALLGSPGILAAHYLSMRSVGFLLLGGSFLTIVTVATLPIGIVLLSQVTRSLAQRRTAQVRVNLGHFINALIESSVFVSIQLLVFADTIMEVWVGKDFSEATRIAQIMILAVPFYFIYGGLRSVVDAAALKAYNTRNILISLVMFFSAAAVVRAGMPPDRQLEGLAVSTVLAICLLSLLTVRTASCLFKVTLDWTKLIPGVGLAAAFGACGVLLRKGLHFQASVPLLLLYGLVVTASYVTVLWLTGSSWLRFLVQSMFFYQSGEPRLAG